MVGLVWVDGGYFKQIKNTSMAYNGSGITLNAGFVFHCKTFCFMFSKILITHVLPNTSTVMAMAMKVITGYFSGIKNMNHT